MLPARSFDLDQRDSGDAVVHGSIRDVRRDSGEARSVKLKQTWTLAKEALAARRQAGRAQHIQMEAIMAEQSSAHAYLNWTKQRIDEMDAALASLEAKASQAKAESKTKADQMIAAMKKRRDEFQAQAKAQAQAGEAALHAGKAQLETQWQDFAAQLETYFATVGQQIEQQQATFRDVVAAQVKAWHAAADTFLGEAGKIAADRRGDFDAAVKQMKADAAEAERRFDQLKQTGSASWAALSAALAESRKVFDRTNQNAGDALKSAAPGQTAAST
jgi:hypothetical protein